jgi:hypothetical protein
VLFLDELTEFRLDAVEARSARAILGRTPPPRGRASKPVGIRQELLDVSVGKTEEQVPADRQGDDLGREAIPGEGRAQRLSDRRMPA